jgi:hypothetical protein
MRPTFSSQISRHEETGPHFSDCAYNESTLSFFPHGRQPEPKEGFVVFSSVLAILQTGPARRDQETGDE